MTRLGALAIPIGLLCLLSAACGGTNDGASTPEGTAGAAGSAGSGGGAGSAGAPGGCDNSLTDYAGDCMQLAPPDPSEGFQLHYGPSDYSDPAEIARYLLQPGEEITDCLYMETPNDEDVFYEEYHARMRPGTHHMIIFGGGKTKELGSLGECEVGPDFQFLVGAQSGINATGAVIDIPGDHEVAPENVGLAAEIKAHTRIAYQLHYINNGKTPILRESWANFIKLKAEDVKAVMAPVTFIGGFNMNIPAHTDQTIKGTCEIPETGPDGLPGPDELRIVTLTGHMHAHGMRFSVFHSDAVKKSRDLVYQTWDWSDPGMVGYDSVTQNPTPDADAQTFGGTNGQLIVKKGDVMEWECDVSNDLDHALKFGNQAYESEMCNLFGGYTPSMGGQWRCIAF